MRLIFIALVLCVAACGRAPDESLVIRLERPELVTLSLVQAGGDSTLELLAEELLAAGSHRAELRAGKWWLDGQERGSVPVGAWSWLAYAHEPFKAQFRGWVCQPGAGGAAAGQVWPEADGAPGAVAVDGASVYLGRSAGAGSGSLLALDANEHLRWSHRRNGFGVHALGVDGGEVLVLADRAGVAGGGVIYKLDAKDGQPLSWGGAERKDLVIGELWSSPGKYPRADAMAVGNGRIYLEPVPEAGIKF